MTNDAMEFQSTESTQGVPSTSTSEPRPPFFGKRVKYDQIHVAQSERCGLGVFATVPMKKGKAVGRVFGEIKPKDFRSDYCVEFGDATLEPYEPYRFLNHSCAPNCEFIEWQIEQEDSKEPVLELWVHTLRDVAVGEELTIDYGWDWESAIPCKCGAPNCRGWICKVEDLELCRKKYEAEKASPLRSSEPDSQNL